MSGTCRPLRVVVVTTSYPLEKGSASGVFVARLVEHLGQEISVTVVTPAGCGSMRPSTGPQVCVQPFRYAPRTWQVLAQRPGGIPAALANNPWLYLLIPPFLLSMAWSVWRAARNADVVHANWAVCGCIAGLAGRARGVPVVTTLRGEDVTRAQRRWIEAAILSWCLHFSMRVVTVSQAFESWLREQFDRFAHKISVIENGVDAQFLRCGEQRTQSRSDSLRLVIIGSLIRRKAVDQAIRALALIADEPSHVSLTIIGSGPEEQHLRDLAVSLGISKQVTFRGHLAPDKVAEMLLAFDVFVLTSLSEGRPNVVLEAMATGLPVIASDIDGVRELITDEQTGLLYRSGETQELAERIRLLQADPSLRARLGKAAHEHIVARGLIWPRTAERYRALYADIVSG